MISPGKRVLGLFSALETLDKKERRELVDLLYNDYLPELVKRWKEDRAVDPHWKMKRIDTICDLQRLKDKDAGWQILGSPPAETVWRFASFDPLSEKDKRDRKSVVRNRRRDPAKRSSKVGSGRNLSTAPGGAATPRSVVAFGKGRSRAITSTGPIGETVSSS